MLTGERRLLENLGNAVLKSFSLLTLNILLQGFLIPISLISIRSLVRRRATSLFTWITSGIILIGFLSSMAMVAIQWVMCLVLIDLGCVEHPTWHLKERQNKANEVLLKWDVAMLWFQLIPPLINDALLVWRGYTIFLRKQWTIYISLFIWIATFATTILLLSEMSAVDTLGSRSTLLNNLFVTVSTLSLATNLLATLSIAQTLWSHQKFVQQNLGHRKRRLTDVSWILFLLVDSGTFYFLFQLVTLILNFPLGVGSSNDVMHQASGTFSVIYTILSAMYPAIVTFVIHGPIGLGRMHDAPSLSLPQ